MVVVLFLLSCGLRTGAEACAGLLEVFLLGIPLWHSLFLGVLASGLDCLAFLCRLASMFCLRGTFSVIGTVSGHADLPLPRGRFSAGVDQQGAKLKYSFCVCCLDTPVP